MRDEIAPDVFGWQEIANMLAHDNPSSGSGEFPPSPKLRRTSDQKAAHFNRRL